MLKNIFENVFENENQSEVSNTNNITLFLWDVVSCVLLITNLTF